MTTSGGGGASTLLRDFQFDGICYSGRAFVPFWGSELNICIIPDESGMTTRKLDALRAILSYQADLRGGFESGLFDYYLSEVEGKPYAFGPGDEPILSPKLSGPAAIWERIRGPLDVQIPSHFRTPQGIEFTLNFECEWDPEHGIGARYLDWRPLEFGGWGDL